MKPTIGSLFAGIGGFDLGFERAGFETLWQVEINEWCQKVLAKNFPHAERFGDIRECGKHNLRPVDVICGGFPCQDISNAGLRAGIEGERSGLWSEMCRVISELRPKFVLVENVAALLGRGMGRVLGNLSEIGYDAEWEVVSAADVGAPHLRERIWVMAYPYGHGCHIDGQDEEGTEGQTFCAAIALGEQREDSFGAGDVADSYIAGLEGRHSAELPECSGEWVAGAGSSLADTQRMRQLQPQGSIANERGRAGDAGWWSVEPNVGRVAHGVPRRVDRLRGLGNAVVPQIPELFAKRIKALLMEAA